MIGAHIPRYTYTPFGAAVGSRGMLSRMSRRAMGQQVIPPGAPENLGPDLFLVLLLGSASYLAIRTGVKDKGFPKYLGWATGIAAGGVGIIALLATIADIGAIIRARQEAFARRPDVV